MKWYDVLIAMFTLLGVAVLTGGCGVTLVIGWWVLCFFYGRYK